MTVRELMTLLSKEDPNAPVVTVEMYDERIRPLNEVWVATVDKEWVSTVEDLFAADLSKTPSENAPTKFVVIS